MKIQLLKVVVLVMAFVISPAVQAQIVPYHVWGTGGVTPDPGFGVTNTSTTFAGPSQGLHLGRLTFAGSAVLTPTANPLYLTWTAVDTQVAANGDELWLTGVGDMTLATADGITFTAVWVGEWTVVGGTGRFRNAGPAAAPIDMVAINEPFKFSDPVWNFSYEKVGNFDLGRRRP